MTDLDLDALWRRDAECRNHDPNLWFPPMFEEGDNRRETPRLYREARRICFSCPVRTDCLEFALEFREEWGMWGGLTRPERNTILRGRRLENAA